MANQSKEAVTLLKELLEQKSIMLSESTRDFHSKRCPTGAPVWTGAAKHCGRE